nr:hypothetical protein [Tanacetum cinerariifolium]
FKAFVSDETATTTFTFLTPVADAVTEYECPNLVRSLIIPGSVDFTLDDVFYEVVDDGLNTLNAKRLTRHTPVAGISKAQKCKKYNANG